MQQVNLYLKEFKTVKPTYSVNVMLFLAGYMLVIGIVVSAILFLLMTQAQATHQELSAQSGEWQAQYNATLQDHPEPVIDEVLLKSIEGYELEVARNIDVLSYLSDRRRVNRKQMFSIYLDSLTKINQEGLWLTKIAITKGGSSLALHGQVLSPDQLPKYINKISELAIFKAMQFEVFDLKRTDKKMEFIISSDIEEVSLEEQFKATSLDN